MKLKFILMAVAIGVGGCTIVDETTIAVIKAVPISDGCIAEAGGNSLSRGFFDVSFLSADYIQSFEVRNNLPNNSEEPYRLNSNDFITERTVVSYSSATTAALDNLELETLVTITFEAESENGFFVNLLSEEGVTLIREQIVPSPGDRADIVAHFVIEGHLADGQGTYGKVMHTSSFAFPIVVCNGCIGCPAGERLLFDCGGGQSPFTCETIPVP